MIKPAVFCNPHLAHLWDALCPLATEPHRGSFPLRQVQGVGKAQKLVQGERPQGKVGGAHNLSDH